MTAPGLTDFAPCTRHGARACPNCYGAVATGAEIGATLLVHSVLEREGIRLSDTSEGLAAHYRIHPPLLFGLLSMLASDLAAIRRVTVLPNRREMLERVMGVLTPFRERLEAVGRGELGERSRTS
jgi:hypothetical protein